MKEDDTFRLEKMFASKAQTRVLEYFLDHPNEPLRLTRVRNDTGLVDSTVHRALINLTRMGLVTLSKKVGRVGLYTLAESEDTRLLVEFLEQISPFLERTLSVDEGGEVSVIVE